MAISAVSFFNYVSNSSALGNNEQDVRHLNEKYSMRALFTNQFRAVQNKTCLAIYSIYSVCSNLEYFFLYKNLFFFVRLNRFLHIWVLKCKISACGFLNH